MSRTQARKQIKLIDYRISMEGIYTTTVNASTLDEAAFAYKPIEEILVNITDSVDIIQVMVLSRRAARSPSDSQE